MGPRRASLIARATVLLTVAASAASGCAAPRGGLGRMGVRADVMDAPSAVVSGGGALVVYEVALRNEGERAVTIERVLRRRSDGGAEQALDGLDLARRVVPKRRVEEPLGRLDLAPGGRAVVLLDAICGAGAATTTFEHDVVLAATTDTGAPAVETITASEMRTSSDVPVTIGPPLRGGGWICENGPSTISGHRRAVVWLHGRPRAAQRFAVDFFRAGADGRTFSGDVARCESYHAFGADVLAVAAARVAVSVDGIPDNVPDATRRAVEMSNDTVAGNHVVLDLGGGRFAMYAHLRNGSVTVRTGDRVARGQVVGSLGNSGNSTEPHLHFHVADGASPVDASGLPFAFDAFAERLGSGTQVQRAVSAPSEGAAVDFLDASHATNGVPEASATK
ncbi:MAG: M23 family metallopeptidase [Planctomycetes bacterium]|nr:M23 family metallopeptidase [Planctomycetota bacterium]